MIDQQTRSFTFLSGLESIRTHKTIAALLNTEYKCNSHEGIYGLPNTKCICNRTLIYFYPRLNETVKFEADQKVLHFYEYNKISHIQELLLFYQTNELTQIQEPLLYYNGINYWIPNKPLLYYNSIKSAWYRLVLLFCECTGRGQCTDLLFYEGYRPTSGLPSIEAQSKSFSLM